MQRENKNVVINNNVILNLFQDLNRFVKQNKVEMLKRVQHDNRVGHHGFTLIELLMVVLIIGILAAVALPKYQLAVAKARYMQLVSLAHALRNGQDLYKMANGKYSNDISVLDIDLPPGTQVVSSKISYPWGFCAIGTTGYACCESTRDGVLYNDLGSLKECKVKPGDTQEFGKKICKSFGGTGGGADGNGYFTYQWH